jgi:hypothetical protein
MFTQRTVLSMNAEVIAAAEVIPAQAGIQVSCGTLGPGLRRGDH